MNPNPTLEPLEFRRLFAGVYSNGMNLNDEATSGQHYAYSLSEMKNLGITSVRVWLTLDSYADRPNIGDIDPRAGQVDLDGVPLTGGYSGAMARAFQLKKLGYHVLLVVSPDKNLLPASEPEVIGFFQHLVNVTESPTSTLRLRDVVDQWEIGNEPDSQNYWGDPSGDKTARLKSYVDKLLLPASSVLHSGDPATWEPVISAGVSYNPADLNTILSYLSSKNQLGAIDYAGFHPYATFDPDTGANQQATNIQLAKQYADSYGKKMIATEWSVRGYSNTGTQDDKYARALDLNYRNYILPNFESAYYFAAVNNWPGRGGSTSARPAGVLEHADSPGISPSIHPDLLGDYYASPIVRSQPFYSTVQSWDSVTPNVQPTPGTAIVGAVWYDFNGDGTVSDQERLAGNQQVWVDLNGDLIRDESEPSAVSDANGIFRIEYTPDLIGASGAIRVESAYPQTAAPLVALGSTIQLLNVSVGIQPDFQPPARVKGSITGTLWGDANNNGVREATETAVAGRIVYIDANNDGVRQLEEYAVLTEPTGRYMFRFLGAGTYVVRVQGPIGEISQSRVITIEQDQRVLEQDLAVVPPAVGSISGVLFDDANANGVFDAGETRTGARVVYLDKNANGLLDTGETQVTADAQGNFTFANLAPGTQNVTRVFPTGYRLSNNTLGYVAVNVAAGQSVSGINIGSMKTPAPVTTATIQGFAYNDANTNGVLDAGDTKTSGKTIFLDANQNGKLDTGEKSTVSAADGSYKFAGLVAGTYYVRRVFPSGYTYSHALVNLTVAAGQTVANANIGSKQGTAPPPPTTTGSISGYLWNDTDRDGLLDTNETRGGVRTVYIDANGNKKLDSGEKSVSSDANGNYKFSNLAAGTYRITRVMATGYKITKPTIGYYSVTLTAGSNLTGYNFGSAVA